MKIVTVYSADNTNDLEKFTDILTALNQMMILLES